tara:strand:- start:773 stop:1057 length:285 start_codon:yes stop_codon:yes gene_type:complete
MAGTNTEAGPRDGRKLYSRPQEYLFNYWLDGPSFQPTGQTWGSTVHKAARKLKGIVGKKPFALFPAAGWGDEDTELASAKYNAKQRKERRKGTK